MGSSFAVVTGETDRSGGTSYTCRPIGRGSNRPKVLATSATPNFPVLPQPPVPPPRVRLLASVIIVGHLAAVFLPPLAFQTRGPFGASPSVTALMAPVLRYAQLLYLDRGYAFFAPDPGPSHLLEIKWTDGQRSVTRRLPDLSQQWPRLRYHRRFMLSEFYHDQYRQPVFDQTAGMPLEQLPVEQRDRMFAERRRFEAIDASVREHAATLYPGEVTIERLEHLLPDFIPYARAPIGLDDPRLFVNLDAIDSRGDPPLGGGPNEPTPPSTPQPIPAPAGEAIRPDTRPSVQTQP